MKLLTNLIFEPKGKHDPALTYNVKDTVMSEDGSRVYFALRDVPVGIPLDDEYYWKLQIDLSACKIAMDDAIASFGNYAKAISTRVKGEIGKASGNPVTFLPDADSLLMPVTVLEPQQQGSGDPYPYLGGKNIFPPWHEDSFEMNGVTFTKQADGSIRAQGTPTAHAYITLTDYKTMRAHGFSEGRYTIHGLPAESDAWFVDLIGDANTQNINFYQNGVVDFTEEVNKNGTYAWRIVITPNMGAVDLVFKIQIEAGTTATEWQPPENIRPITGWDALGLNHAGKNLLEPVPELTQYNANDTRFFYKVGELPDGAYFLKCSNSDAYAQEYRSFILYDANRETQLFSVSYVLDGVIQIENAKGAVYAMIIVGVANADIGTTQLEYGTSRSAYVPYVGKLHTVQIGQTVYGGKFDWLTGKLMAEWGFTTVKHMNLNGKHAETVLMELTIKDAESETLVVCDTFPSALYGQALFKNMACIHTRNRLFVGLSYDLFGASYDADVSVLSDAANQWLANNPLQIAYKLATPIEIQLDPTIISAADPEQTNTLYGDGSIEVEYVKPLHVSIEERVAAALAAMHE